MTDKIDPETSSGESWSRSELSEMLIEILETEILNTDAELRPESNLEESGLDSLKLTQVLLSVEERTGLWLDEKHLTPENLRTVQTLADCIHDVLEE